MVLIQEDLSYDDPDRKMYHLCIVNLVIGYVTYHCRGFMHICHIYYCTCIQTLMHTTVLYTVLKETMSLV